MRITAHFLIYRRVGFAHRHVLCLACTMPYRVSEDHEGFVQCPRQTKPAKWPWVASIIRRSMWCCRAATTSRHCFGRCKIGNMLQHVTCQWGFAETICKYRIAFPVSCWKVGNNRLWSWPCFAKTLLATQEVLSFHVGPCTSFFGVPSPRSAEYVI